jgi:hypothetical protein
VGVLVEVATLADVDVPGMSAAIGEDGSGATPGPGCCARRQKEKSERQKIAISDLIKVVSAKLAADAQLTRHREKKWKSSFRSWGKTEG